MATRSSPVSAGCVPRGSPASTGSRRCPQLADHEQLELALVENLQRRDLDPLEGGHAYQHRMELSVSTQDAVAPRSAQARSTVANTLRLLDLAPEVQRRWSTS